MRRLVVAVTALGAACASPEPTKLVDDDHPPMPEAMAPIVQVDEDGPISEGLFVDVEETGALTLLAPASRATVWLRLADASAADATRGRAARLGERAHRTVDRARGDLRGG